ncbi:MAG: TraB/GumN family protein [Brevundimonas sp.]|uniref:TraB/GumN family protein n=1 Tax=Brevundimonas sp. TaxID=1871086 RepID=UPI002734DF79|nr:TraB/GumN family protein [Brevundimonas sp.]MDP3404278.1 TraB/GumN family protein [Brevundimonas sp.]
MSLASLRHTLRTALPAAIGGLVLFISGGALAEPAIWAVRDHDSTVFLFGTIHVMKSDTAWRSPRFDAAFSSADTLILEVENPEDQAAVLPLIQEHGLSPDRPLSSLLSAEDLSRLDTAAKSVGLSAAQLDPLRPWLASLSLAAAPLRRAGFDPASGIDPVLRAEALAAGMTVAGLETLDQQVRLLAGFPEAGQLAYLMRSLNDFDEGAAQLERLVEAWLAGDVAGVGEIGVRSMREVGEGVYQVLLVERNRAWAERISATLDDAGTTFIAVGALHLAGEDSVQRLLEDRGLTVERVQ